MRGAHRPVCHAAEVHRPLRGSAAALSSTVMRRGLLHSFRPSHVSVAAFLLAAATASAWAQFKVVGPDGRVTYTDRAPSDASARVTPIRPDGIVEASTPEALPPDLSQIAARYPVTLPISKAAP